MPDDMDRMTHPRTPLVPDAFPYLSDPYKSHYPVAKKELDYVPLVVYPSQSTPLDLTRRHLQPSHVDQEPSPDFHWH